jgi:FkbM family methyltransferase
MKIRTIDGKYAEIQLSEAAAAHVADPHNYALFILDEWEHLPYSDYIRPGSVILDIGANVGLFALHVKPYAKRLVCVEPTPQHMAIQRELVQAEHEQAALNHYTGTARFRNEPVNTTMNTLSNGPGAYDVNCITLRDLCEKYQLENVDFCKIDIEGSEWQALTAERIAEVSGIIRSFFVELHPRTAEAQAEMAARFEKAGYQVKAIDYNGSIYAYET